MEREKVVRELRDLGCVFQLQEEGVHFFNVYIPDQYLGAFKDLIEALTKETK